MSNSHPAFAVAAILVLFGSAPSRSETAQPEIVEIAAGIFVHHGVHEDASPANDNAIANIGFVLGDDAVAVIDPGGSAREGRELRAGDPGAHRPADPLRDPDPRPSRSFSAPRPFSMIIPISSDTPNCRVPLPSAASIILADSGAIWATQRSAPRSWLRRSWFPIGSSSIWGAAA